MYLLEQGCLSENDDTDLGVMEYGAAGEMGKRKLVEMDEVLGEMWRDEIGDAGFGSVGGTGYGLSQVIFVLLHDDISSTKSSFKDSSPGCFIICFNFLRRLSQSVLSLSRFDVPTAFGNLNLALLTWPAK